MKLKLHHSLGTWGATLGHLYFDLRINWDDHSLRLFSNRAGAKSWYRLRRYGWRLRWHLLRREDQWGTYYGGGGLYNQQPRRRPPLYNYRDPMERAWELRQQFVPYQLIDWYGTRMEVMSYPVPNTQTVSVMLRLPDDPTTLREEVLEEYMPPETPLPRT